MIREVINFTKDLLKDCPEIMQWNQKLKGGLYILIRLDEEGNWKNENLQYKEDYFYFSTNSTEEQQEKQQSIQENLEDLSLQRIEEKLKKYEEKTILIEMNKAIDSKKIHSASPYAVAFRKKSFSELSEENFNSYFKRARNLCGEENEKEFSRCFQQPCISILNEKVKILQTELGENIFEKLGPKDYISIFWDNDNGDNLSWYEKAHTKYLRLKLFNKDVYNQEKDKKTYGLSGFLNGTNEKKPFLIHQTGVMKGGVNIKITQEDALSLYQFERLLSQKTFPNPLPVIIDKRELNTNLIRIFNRDESKKGFHQLIRSLFEGNDEIELSNYYLLNYSKGKSIIINDIDFVPLFRYELNLEIEDLFEVSEGRRTISVKNIFDFERIVLSEIFNNALVKVKNGEITGTNYFGDLNKSDKSIDSVMFQLILKYRKSFYDYIYKSRVSAITPQMFDDMMYTSILSNIRTDKIIGLISGNFRIRRKLNIWFNLTNFFNKDMSENLSKIADLHLKMQNVSEGKLSLETGEEFAFAAGQIVSYLLDRSASAEKTYSLLEPYLQKSKSGQLQDAVAHTVSIYKHDINIYHGAFQELASNVFTFSQDLDMKPLLKFFLAGCFSSCVIYKKKNQESNSVEI